MEGADAKIEHRLGGGGVDSHAVMVSALTDTLLLAECDYLVLSLSSTMSRMALLLAAARQKRLPPFVSVRRRHGGARGERGAAEPEAAPALRAGGCAVLPALAHVL